MNRQEIIDRINTFLEEDFEADPAGLIPDASLKHALDLDSLDYIDLVVAIEHHFGFKVKPEDFQTMHTLNDFYNYVEQKMEVAKS
jgi:acyl carrier protein